MSFDDIPSMPSVVPSAPETDETRYTFERRLGQGGAGAVYLVKDRETGEQLALKKLLHVDAKAVLRLKREFRSLADVHHPNLVKLYDLGSASDSWFMTMEKREQLCAEALARFSQFGYVDPRSFILGAYPELAGHE